MGAQCNSCGCNDQGEFKMNEVQLDDKSLQRKNKAYGGAYSQDVSVTRARMLDLSEFFNYFSF